MTQPASPLDVVFVVVTWNSARHLERLLSSVVAGCDGLDGWEVVVADNASTDASVQVARAFGAKVISTGRNAGYAAGVNAAVDAAPAARAFLVLNPDVQCTPGSVRRLLDALDRGAYVGIVVPRLVDASGQLVPSLRREPTVMRAIGEAVLGGRRAGRWSSFGELVVDPSRYEVGGPADWASGAAMLVSHECLEAVGRWEEEFFLYSEETDYALRARDAGYHLVYAPEATLVHEGGDAHVSSRLWSMLTVNRVRCYARRHGPVRTALFRAAVVVNEALRVGRARNRAALASLLMRSRRPPEVRGALR